MAWPLAVAASWCIHSNPRRSPRRRRRVQRLTSLSPSRLSTDTLVPSHGRRYEMGHTRVDRVAGDCRGPQGPVGEASSGASHTTRAEEHRSCRVAPPSRRAARSRVDVGPDHWWYRYRSSPSASARSASLSVNASRAPSSSSSPSLSQRLMTRMVVSTVVPVMSARLWRVR